MESPHNFSPSNTSLSKALRSFTPLDLGRNHLSIPQLQDPFDLSSPIPRTLHNLAHHHMVLAWE